MAIEKEIKNDEFDLHCDGCIRLIANGEEYLSITSADCVVMCRECVAKAFELLIKNLVAK